MLSSTQISGTTETVSWLHTFILVNSSMHLTNSKSQGLKDLVRESLCPVKGVGLFLSAQRMLLLIYSITTLSYICVGTHMDKPKNALIKTARQY